MTPPFDGSFGAGEHRVVAKPKASLPAGPDAALRAELLALAGTLDARAMSVGFKGRELERLVRDVRAAVRGEPVNHKDREGHARSLLFAYCEVHAGEGELPPRELKTAAACAAQGLADAMPEFATRARGATEEIAAVIQARAAVRRRGRPERLKGIIATMSAPHIDQAARDLCKAMGWSKASGDSLKRQRRRKKK